MQDFIQPWLLLPSSESCFSFRPLKSEWRGPYRSQSEAGRPQRRSSQPLGLYGGGGIREASACVAAIVYRGTRGWLNNPPVNTAVQWETRKWQDPRDMHTHMPFPWSWRIDFVLFGRHKEEEGGRGGELVSNSSWFLNGYEEEEEEEAYEKVYGLQPWNLTSPQIIIKKSKSKQAVSWSG